MKKLVTSYTFDASAQTVDSADFTSLEKILLITNVTDQVIIYNFADSNKGGSLSSTTLTLEHDTTSMSDTDKLQIFVEVANLTQGTTPSDTQPVSASSLPLPTGASTSAKQDTIIGHVDGIEGLLTTIDADTGNISTKIDTIAGAVSGTEVQVDVLTMPTVAVTQSGTWDEVGINDSGNSITIDYNGSAISTSNAVPVQPPASGYLNIAIDQTGNNNAVDVLTMPTTTVQATNLDIRDLTSSSDSVAVLQATHDNLNLNANLQVANTDVSTTNAVPTKGVPSDIDINGGNANHADKYYTNAGAVTDGIIWSPAAGKRWHITLLYINVSAAATVTIEDDLAGGDVVRWKGELAANSGIVLPYGKEHPMASGEDAADLLITTSAGNVYVQAVGYEV